MSSTRGVLPNQQRAASNNRKTTGAHVEGASNIIGNNNHTVNVTINSHPDDALSDEERAIVRHYRRTDELGRITIHQVAVLAAKKNARRSK